MATKKKAEEAAVSSWPEVAMVKVDFIDPNPFQRRPEDEDVSDLAKSIETVGLIHPIVVCRTENDRFMVCAGHRRLAAVKSLGLSEISASVLASKVDNRDILVAENIVRKNLPPMLEAAQIGELTEVHNVGEVAAILGRSQNWVYRRRKLLDLNEKWQEAAKSGVASHWPASMLELVAYLPPDKQTTLFEMHEWKLFGMKPETLEKIVTDMTRTLADAKWDLDDPALNPDMGSCSSCPLRASVNPGLFEDGEKTDRCLDYDCWTTKLQAFAARQFVEAHDKAPGAAFIRTSEYTGVHVEVPEDIEVYSPWQVDDAKKSTPGAIPALQMSANGTIRKKYVVPHAKPVMGDTTKKKEKTLDEKRKGLDRRRKKLAIASCVSHAWNLRTPSPVEMLKLVAAFGVPYSKTDPSYDGYEPLTHDGDTDMIPWVNLSGLSSWSVEEVVSRIRGFSLAVIAKRWEYKHAQQDLEQVWEDVLSYYEFFDAREVAERFYADAIAKIKEPKAWAKYDRHEPVTDEEEAEAKASELEDPEPEPEQRKCSACAPEEEEKPPATCRVCGCEKAGDEDWPGEDTCPECAQDMLAS